MLHIKKAVMVSGMPHLFLAPEQNPGWGRLRDAYHQVQKELEADPPDLLLYFSTQWLSILGYMVQSQKNPEWVHVDQNWHTLGSIPYSFDICNTFSGKLSQEIQASGFLCKEIDYKGFPIDTGTIVAQKLLNPKNRMKAAMVSCNMYSEREETLSLGMSCYRTIAQSQISAAVVLVSNLSNRFHVTPTSPAQDHISCQKDHEWNLKLLKLLEEGRLEDASQITRDFGKQANGDQKMKGLWWLNGLLGKTNDLEGKVLGYEPILGAGACVVTLTPRSNPPLLPAQPLGQLLEEGSQALLMEEWTDYEGLHKGSFKKTKSTVSSHQSPPTPTQVTPDIIDVPGLAEPMGVYPHARRQGDLLFVCGMGPRKRGMTQIPGSQLNSSGEVIGYDIKVETESVIENIKTILEHAGTSLENVIDVQVFLTNMKRDFKDFNETYARYFSKIRPTRTTVEVLSLPSPIHVELKVIARMGSSSN
jgi:enamine deaminase RidA (YjgF/YER057c/UK114 family)/aromatic ring-opening dioxygenase catalytic subunit (LigB family)